MELYYLLFTISHQLMQFLNANQMESCYQSIIKVIALCLYYHACDGNQAIAR